MTEALGRMSLRAKVAQLVFPPVYGDGRNRDEALDLARAGVGGFVFYEGVSPADTAKLVAALREASEPTGLPLVIAADQGSGPGGAGRDGAAASDGLRGGRLGAAHV